MSLRQQLSKVTALLKQADALAVQKRGRQRRRLLVEQMEDRRLLTVIDLATLTATQGSVIYGVNAGDESGNSVSSAGDVNGDGFDDLLIGAFRADAFGNGKANAGDSYVIFGKPLLPTSIDLNNPGAAGVTIFGADEGDHSGSAVSGAGDVNGDGFDDLLIGAYLANASGNSKPDAGNSYVIFGSKTLPPTIDLANLEPAVMTVFGADVNDQSGFDVAGIGDVNADGYDDLLIGAVNGDASEDSRSDAGDSFVVFGSASLPASINLSNLGTAGITIFGADKNDQSGFSVRSSGDINGDGFDDMLIGAKFADGQGDNKSGAGDSYLIFGGLTPINGSGHQLLRSNRFDAFVIAFQLPLYANLIAGTPCQPGR